MRNMKWESRITLFFKFCLEPLRRYSRSKLDDFHQQYMKHKIEPTLMEDSQNTMNRHQENDDTILVITATNNFIAAPIVKTHGIEN